MKKIEMDHNLIRKIADDIKNKQNKEFGNYEGKIIFRPHGGGSVFDSLEKAKEFSNIQEMKEYIAMQRHNYLSVEDIVIQGEATEDSRIGWKDTRYVCTKRFGEEDYIEKYGCPQCIGYCATEYLK